MCSVPDFEVDDEEPLQPLSPSSAQLRRKAKSSYDEDLMEILWQKGPVTHPVQSDRSRRRFTPEPHDAALPGRVEPVSGGYVGTSAAVELFMEEDEMATWLHYQMDEGEDDGRGNMYEQLLGSSPGSGSSGGTQAEPQDAPAAAAAERKGAAVASRESTVSETVTGRTVAEPEPTCGGLRTCEQGVASSSGASVQRAAARDERKRKAREGEDTGCHSEDVDFESGDKRKDARRSTSARRTRAAEVHNLSERRRRDRINEKMKALQELIPRCHKSDKASMLDEAIEYLKSLQLQVQMMSMGCSMGPLMYPGMQAYLPPMGMGMNMGMGMGMGLGIGTGIPMGTELGSGGLGRPILPFGLPCPAIPGSSPVPLGARPFMPSLHPPSMAVADQFSVQRPNQQDVLSNLYSMRGTNMVQFQNVVGPHHPQATSHGLQTTLQSRAMAESGTSKEIDNSVESKLG